MKIEQGYEKHDTEVKPKPSTKSSRSPTLSSNDESGELFYYLHKPLTIGASRVLISMSPTDKLEACLRNREILEYPTIYVLKHPPTDLPDGFLLEKDYYDQRQRLVKEVEEELGSDYDSLSKTVKSEIKVEEEDDDTPNNSRIYESLQRDIDVIKQYVT